MNIGTSSEGFNNKDSTSKTGSFPPSTPTNPGYTLPMKIAMPNSNHEQPLVPSRPKSPRRRLVHGVRCYFQTDFSSLSKKSALIRHRLRRRPLTSPSPAASAQPQVTRTCVSPDLSSHVEMPEHEPPISSCLRLWPFVRRYGFGQI